MYVQWKEDNKNVKLGKIEQKASDVKMKNVEKVLFFIFLKVFLIKKKRICPCKTTLSRTPISQVNEFEKYRKGLGIK